MEKLFRGNCLGGRQKSGEDFLGGNCPGGSFLEGKCLDTTKITTLNKFFSWVLLYPRTTDPPTKRPLTIYPPTHQPRTQRLAELIIILERIDNRNMFILQNTSTTGKTYNYSFVYYPKKLLVSMKHIRRSQLYLFLNFNLYSSADISKFYT